MDGWQDNHFLVYLNSATVFSSNNDSKDVLPARNPVRKRATLKTTFWPMIGGIGQGFANYLLVLRTIDRGKMSKRELVEWLVERFGLAASYAANVVTTLFTGLGVVELRDGICAVAKPGRALLDNSSPRFLYALFADQFLGVAEIPALLTEQQPLTADALFSAWFDKIRRTIQKRWTRNHARMQFKHRVDWLRSLDIVNRVADGYYLSVGGMEETAQAKMRAAGSIHERDAISHNDIEDKLKSIGQFFEFMAIKRASVNDARPARVARLSENRQLDCLWARIIHFGGKVQYAFEVQLSGNVSDAIERLEMVAPFVQKAVVVTDEVQQGKIEDRLRVKHSPLCDKLLFLSYDDINQIAAAVNALKVFTGKVFHE